MPGSPASASRRSPGAYSNTKTKRSTVSAAFNTSGASGTAPTQTNSAVVYGKSTSPKEPSGTRSVSRKPSSPGSTAQRASVVTVGTVTDPDATASQLLATKTPQIMAGGSTSIIKSPSVSITGKTPSTASARNASIAAAPSVSVPAASSLAGGGGGSTKVEPASVSHGTVKSPSAVASTSRPTEPASILPASSVADGQVSSMADNQPVGHGIIDVTVRTGAVIEMSFSAIGCILFASLFIYMLRAPCYKDDWGVFLIQLFSAFGLVASLMILLYTCFEARFDIRRGVTGCFAFFILAVIIFINLYGAFLAMNCVCKCSQNAFASGKKEDIIIFVTELAGAFCLIAVVLISSVVHEDHHHKNQHQAHSAV